MFSFCIAKKNSNFADRMVELKDASLSVGGKSLFAHLSMIAHQGQITCITGGAGTGKTLLLRVMLGFVALDEGLISIDGELLTALSASVFRRMMAYVPQSVSPCYSGYIPDTDDLETVWGDGKWSYYDSQPLEKPVVVVQDKPIVIVDDPDVSLLSQLSSLASDGKTVIIASRQKEFLNMSDKVIILENNDILNS